MKTESKPAWVFLFGPTAVGKTQALYELKLRGLPLEVISADAFQIYRGLDIGTAKPHADLLAAVPHHLLDIRDPQESFSVSDFVQEADLLAREIRARGAIPVVSGGTAFYYRHLYQGLPQAPEADPELRSQVAQDLRDQGPEALYQELKSKDPQRAAELHPNDLYRISRAVEIIRSSGQAQSSFRVTGRGGLLARNESVLMVGMERPREELRDRIRARVENMFAQGLEQEISGLLESGCGPQTPAMRAIGYKEFFEDSDPGIIREKIFFHSSQYAKRQMTFFRSFKETVWFQADDCIGIHRRLDQAFNS